MKRRVPIHRRLTAYLRAIFAKGTRFYRLDMDALARSFSCTKRTVENALVTVRESGAFRFEKKRIGRSYSVFCYPLVFAARISDRNSPHLRGFCYAKKEYQNTAAPDLKKSSQGGWQTDRKAPPRILALAAWFARNVLCRAHRSISRTMPRFAHAYRFAADALHAGFSRDAIADAYRYALRSIDDDLAHLPRSVRWEPSSLIRLARRRLVDGLSMAERVAIRRRALAVESGESSAVSSIVENVIVSFAVPKASEETAFSDLQHDPEFAALLAAHAQ
ncbi:hypothetical protein [Geminisphaera colitermitum]|uniref:hypothetical protein n=1 Tax=Geminisphaera colitermitum TaxID=1148786 RepID=UPI000158C975|nr:hypothetical protein [Geminisphaera colitermitum]